MHKSRFSEKLRQEILNKYQNGAKIIDLCQEYNISKSYLYKWVKESKKFYRKYKKQIISAQYVYMLERQISELKIENEIFKETGCGLNTPLKEKLKVIKSMSGKYTVYSLCKTLGVLRSTYYHYTIRAPVKKWYEIRADMLRPKIQEIFDASGGRFGAGKIAIKLKKEGLQVGQGSIARLMKEMGLICKQNLLHSYNTTNKYSKYRKNRLRREFYQATPNTFWVSDITYILTKQGDCYICSIIDLFSRKVIAFDVSSQNNADFVLQTFAKAFQERGSPKGLTFHSDQGSQYTAKKFRSFLRQKGVKQSFSNPGTPYDNAVAESFFSMMKRESLSHKLYSNIEELKKDVEEFITFFNDYRPLRKLNNLSPNEFEEEYTREQAELTQQETDLKEFLQRL